MTETVSKQSATVTAPVNTSMFANAHLPRWESKYNQFLPLIAAGAAGYYFPKEHKLLWTAGAVFAVYAVMLAKPR